MACCEACEKSGGNCGGSEPGTGTCSGNKRANGPNSGCGEKGKPFGMNVDLPNDATSALAGACCENCAKTGGNCGQKPPCCGDKQQWADKPFGLAPDLAPDVRASLAGFEEVVEGLGDAPAAAPFSWGTFLVGAAVGVGGSILASMFLLNAADKSNPAHENFVGRRVELHPGHDLWMRGARYGKIIKVHGDVLSVRMDHPAVKRLVRVRKDRVTLI